MGYLAREKEQASDCWGEFQTEQNEENVPNTKINEEHRKLMHDSPGNFCPPFMPMVFNIIHVYKTTYVYIYTTFLDYTCAKIVPEESLDNFGLLHACTSCKLKPSSHCE